MFTIYTSITILKLLQKVKYIKRVIPPDELEDYIKKYNIVSVIDLRFPGTNDVKNNPEVPEEFIAEQEAIAKLSGVNYYNNGSHQVPE